MAAIDITSIFETVMGEELRPLTDVSMLQLSDCADILSIRLTFGSKVIFVTVNVDDDTVTAGSSPPPVPDGAHWVKACGIWESALRKRIEWVWALENNQGYTDGVQMEFVSLDGPDRACIQMVAEASNLSVRQVVRTQ